MKNVKNLLYIYLALFNITIIAQVNNSDVFLKPQNSPTSNCDYCLCSLGVNPLDFSGKGIRIDPRYLLIDRTVNNGSSAPNNNGRYEEHFTMQFSGIYSFKNHISIIAAIPYSIRNGRDNYNSSLVHTTGIGDISILGRYNILEKHVRYSTFMLAFQGGIKLPSGKAEEKTSTGELIDPHLQTGTGSTDFLLGTNFLYAIKRFALTTNLLYGIKTRGRNGYRFGNDLNYDIAARYRIFQTDIGENMVLLNAGFSGEYKGKESQDGITIDNSGGNTLYLSSGIDYFITPYVLIGLQVQKPIYYNLSGIQDGETFRIKSGIQFLF
jgi:hypothetical protein